MAKYIVAHLKSKSEYKSTWEDSFYQSECVKINSIELFKFFPFMCVAANASKFFCMAHLANIERILYYSSLSI